ncbi:MAG: hypothetical protein JW936_08045 [Sedimentisphaerales bacterium]|nr:hypothetical protein [Sedimentisphaerales bacterium]
MPEKEWDKPPLPQHHRPGQPKFPDRPNPHNQPDAQPPYRSSAPNNSRLNHMSRSAVSLRHKPQLTVLSQPNTPDRSNNHSNQYTVAHKNNRRRTQLRNKPPFKDNAPSPPRANEWPLKIEYQPPNP